MFPLSTYFQQYTTSSWLGPAHFLISPRSKETAVEQDMMTVSYGLCVLLLAVIPAYITAYKSGAPESVCGSMIPDHHSEPKSEPSPYTITPNKLNIEAGKSIEVTISGTDNTKFRGYFIQARVGNTPIGKFATGPEINLVDCGSGVGSAATHTDNRDKDSITLNWTAPARLSESVRFRTTFVKTGPEYWVGQESDPITVK
ncbi:putative defense protein Hdd11 isoform X2 [Zootermopsis nevadensis]|uniref:Putative defense protein Hdd11-like n=1 Tax=Zootermopsis nevadensis TaxID=136037 RepID=A0A067QWZ1_ZOONE|nr:putative defense protein Hdd11 isoform X2 [Zootermopsis nevadensis]KDR14834.1 Putative defense protein Hdd11-like [Zootermopsis nevadensis]